MVCCTQPDNYAPFLHDALVLYAKLVNESGADYQKGEVLRNKASDRIFQGNGNNIITFFKITYELIIFNTFNTAEVAASAQQGWLQNKKNQGVQLF